MRRYEVCAGHPPATSANVNFSQWCKLHALHHAEAACSGVAQTSILVERFSRVSQLVSGLQDIPMCVAQSELRSTGHQLGTVHCCSPLWFAGNSSLLLAFVICWEQLDMVQGWHRWHGCGGEASGGPCPVHTCRQTSILSPCRAPRPRRHCWPTLRSSAQCLRSAALTLHHAQHCQSSCETRRCCYFPVHSKKRIKTRDAAYLMRLKLGAQVMDALPEWSGELEVRLGHRSLLDASLTHAHVPKVSRPCHLHHGAP